MKTFVQGDPHVPSGAFTLTPGEVKELKPTVFNCYNFAYCPEMKSIVLEDESGKHYILSATLLKILQRFCK